MRTLMARPNLPKAQRDKLRDHSASLLSAPDPKKIVEQRFNSARDTNWFSTIRNKLMDMAGSSRACMFCDHNEPTDVEHFKPKSEFPEETFSWKNMLWICATCNRLKGNKFPPHNCEGQPLIDPVVDRVWEFFLLDEFGNLVKRWDPNNNAFNQRAASTCKYALVDREELQTRRQKRMKAILREVRQATSEFSAGTLSLPQLNERVTEWLAEPFQADVADYFFRGPGRTQQPFAGLLALGVTVSPL